MVLSNVWMCLTGFHQQHMTRQVTFFHTELQPKQRMLKHKAELEALGEDIYVQTKLDTYLNRPVELATLTYTEFYLWWRSATSAQQNLRRLLKLQRKTEIFAFVHVAVMILVTLWLLKKLEIIASSSLLSFLARECMATSFTRYSVNINQVFRVQMGFLQL